MTTPPVCILVVEDDPQINYVLRALLADEAILALSAASLREARNHIRTRNVLGVVLDYSLPDGCADELLRELSQAEHPPGVVLASAHPGAIPLAIRYGLACIRKPLDFEVVLAVVRSFLAGKNQPQPPRD